MVQEETVQGDGEHVGVSFVSTVLGVVALIIVVSAMAQLDNYRNKWVDTTATVDYPPTTSGGDEKFECFPVTETVSRGNVERQFQSGFVCPIAISFRDKMGTTHSDVVVTTKGATASYRRLVQGDTVPIQYNPVDPRRTAVLHNFTAGDVDVATWIIVLLTICAVAAISWIYHNRAVLSFLSLHGALKLP